MAEETLQEFQRELHDDYPPEEKAEPIVDPKTISVAAGATETYTASFKADFLFVSTLDGDPVHVSIGQTVDSEKYWPLKSGGFLRLAVPSGQIAIKNAHASLAASVTITALKNVWNFHHKARG